MPIGISKGLFDAILADPDNDAPRLVCSDALQAEGDSRGELIAVQCELGRLGCGPDSQTFLDWVGDLLADDAALAEGRVVLLRQRERLLLRKNRAACIAEVFPDGRLPSRARIWRGFVDEIGWDLRAEDLGGIEAVMERAPIQSLMPIGTTSVAELASFLELPALDRVQEIYNGAVFEAGLVPFTRSALPGLRRLLLSHAGGPHELAALPRAAFLPRLTGLVLNGFASALQTSSPSLRRR